MRKIVFTGLWALCLCSCQSLLPEKVDIVTLGIVPESIVIGEQAGEDGVRMIADRDYHVDVVSGADWLTVGLSKSDSLSFAFTANEGFRRSACIRVSADGREDELQIKQEGPYQEVVSLSEHEFYAPAEGCSVSLRVYSNIPSDYFSVTGSHENAIGKIVLRDYVLSFDVLPTTNRDKRRYTVTVSFVDGWGDVLSDAITIVQEAYD